MILSRTASEILRGSWFMEPQTASRYLDASVNILTKKKTDFDERLAMTAIREVRSMSGDLISADEQIPEGSVGIVSIMGPMLKYGDYCSWGAEDLVGFAQQFEANDNIVGQIWRMDSGGGAVTAIAPFLDFLAQATKPVVSLADTSASANYYVASATDYIMAENSISSMFGSIGVMIEFADFAEYYKEKGIKVHTVYADQSTHKNTAFEKAKEGDYKSLKQEMLNPLAVKFQEAVRANRPNLNQEVEGILNGKMFFAEDALAHGLIDGIGNMSTAIEKVKLLAAARSFINDNY